MAGLPKDRLLRPKVSKTFQIAHISQNEYHNITSMDQI